MADQDKHNAEREGPGFPVDSIEEFFFTFRGPTLESFSNSDRESEHVYATATLEVRSWR